MGERAGDSLLVDVLRGQPPLANWAAAQKPQPSVRAPERSTGFLGLSLLGCVCAVTAQSCLTLHDPMDCSPPGSSVHGVSKARILEQLAIFSSRGSSQPGD